MVRRVSSGDDPADRSGDPPPTTEPEPATEEEVEATVAEISDFVAQERGLDFLEPVDRRARGRGAFQDRLLADFDEDAEELRETEVFLEGLGLVEPDIDLVESMRSLLGVGVVGFYDPETDELVVRGAALTPYVRTTIAHELAHALDDQHFDLDRPEYDEADDESASASAPLVEGNARRVENAYRDVAQRARSRPQATAEETRPRQRRRHRRHPARPRRPDRRPVRPRRGAGRADPGDDGGEDARRRRLRRPAPHQRAGARPRPLRRRRAGGRRCRIRRCPARWSTRACSASCSCCSSSPTASDQDVAAHAADGLGRRLGRRVARRRAVVRDGHARGRRR